MRRLVLTAFGPFPGCPANPTGRLVRGVVERLFGEDPSLPGWRAEVRELPTDWSAPSALIAELKAEDPAPDVVISLGVRDGSPGISVERVAINAVGIGKTDVGGKAPESQKLHETGADRLDGRLHQPPFGGVVEAAQEVGHPVTFSDDAGRYLCNALFFHLLNDLVGADAKRPLVGFVHVPHIAGQTAPETAKSALEEQVIVDALAELVRGWCQLVEAP